MTADADLLARPALDEDWVVDELSAAGLANARNTVGCAEPGTLELLVDGLEPVRIDLDADAAEDAGRAVAAALLRRDDVAWRLRATVYEEELGASVLISEWTGATA